MKMKHYLLRNALVLIIVLSVLSVLVCLCLAQDELDDQVYQVGDNPTPKVGVAKDVKYLLYDVNPGEGFNLRRDVYLRVANLVKFLNEESPWVLVLPPWGRLYHWQSRHIESQIKIPWGTFFDIPSLSRHIPVMEFESYLKLMGKPEIEEVYYLQRFEEGWTKWEEKLEVRKCISKGSYKKNEEEGVWYGWFYGYENVYAKKFICLSSQSSISSFKTFLLNNVTATSVFIDRAENLIHGMYSEWSPEYWTARRSMVFSKALRDIGDEFRKDYLDSYDEDDKTVLENWKDMKRNHGDAVGGPYLAVHLRRKDYLYGHNKEVPSLEYAAKQVKKYLKQYKVTKLYVATDAPEAEFETFKEQFKKTEVHRFVPTKEIHETYKDGGIAIIDQWICAHARAFVGTYVSTFTFRIHEEREILGFDPETTFNRLCGDEEDKNCEQPTKWKIIY